METEQRPHERWRGRLKNDNPRGDLSAVKKCGAKTRSGGGCCCPAMRNGRCRLHGGLSTGPKTREGRDRIRVALLKHGRYTKEAEQERPEWRELMRISMELLHQLKGLPHTSSMDCDRRKLTVSAPCQSGSCSPSGSGNQKLPMKPAMQTKSATVPAA
jgi:hypothetical protein